MFGLITIEFLVVISLFIAWNSTFAKIRKPHDIVIALLFLILLIIVETFRDGSVNPDYELYLQYIKYPLSNSEEAEKSFFTIVSLSNSVGGSYIIVFLIYAILGTTIKLYAIYKYSINIIYSICTWMAFSFILHDLIQIRAAVSAGLLLLMIPHVDQKDYLSAIFIWFFAFLFHNSAILFGILFLLNNRTIKPWFWVSCYVIIFVVNFFNLPIFSAIFQIISFFPSSIAQRIGDSDPSVLNSLPRMTMYSRYVLIPTLFCFAALYYRKRIIDTYPGSIICLKICFIGLYFYGISLPIVSERIFELLSVPYIYLVPTALFWFKNDKEIKGKIVITIFCLFMSWNLLFKQEVFS